MAIYVISDIHGAYNRFIDLLEQVKFDYDKDTLYVLGDCCDRLPNSGKMIEWMIEHKDNENIKYLLGNHEDLMLSWFKEYEGQFVDYDVFYNSVWSWNGGDMTWEYLMDLPREKRKEFLSWVRSWPLFYDIEVNGERFVLVHAGIAINGVRLEDDYYDKGLYKWVEIDGFLRQWSQSLLWIRNNWFRNNSELPCHVIFGHTSTSILYEILESMKEYYDDLFVQGDSEKICHFGCKFQKHAIDTGRQVLGMLRLDDWEEFYSDVKEF